MRAQNAFRIIVIVSAVAVIAIVVKPAAAQHVRFDFGFGHHGFDDYGHHFDHHYSDFHHYDNYFPPRFDRHYVPLFTGHDYYDYPPVIVRRYYRVPPDFFDRNLRSPRAMPRRAAPLERRPLPGEFAPPAIEDASKPAPSAVNDGRAIPQGFLKLSPADRAAALAQRTCPVTGDTLGEHAAPIKVRVRGRDVFVCCDGCVDELKDNPDKFLPRVARRG